MTTNETITTLKNQSLFVFVILLELIYLVLSIAEPIPLIKIILVFPCLFIIPGLMLLIALGSNPDTSLAELVIKGFFVSTLLLVFTTSSFLLLNIPFIPLTYSLTNFSLVLIATIISVVRKREPKLSKSGFLFTCLVFATYLFVLLFINIFPRFFAPDETSYISTALSGIIDGVISPVGIRPDRAELIALLQGRYFWTYLLCSFICSTGVAGYQAGLIGASFLIMTALTSSLIVKERWMRITVFVIVTLTPRMFYFSALSLNDLALAFYAVFAVLFFSRSFARTEGSVSISVSNLVYSAMGLAALSLIKLNILVLVVMWVLSVYILLRYRLYKTETRYKILLALLVLPVLLYEFCLDIPYVISVWFLQNEYLGSLFGGFLFVSPVEQILGWFLAPPWNPGAVTVFSHGITSSLDYFYCLLSPEASNFLVSAVIVALPLLLLLSPGLRKEFHQSLLAWLILLSLGLFYFNALGSSYISDVGRLSLWIVPLMIPLTLLIMSNIINNPLERNLLPVFLGALLLFLINLFLTIVTIGGVWIDFGFEFRLWTIIVTTLQLAALTTLLASLVHTKRKNYTSFRISLGKSVKWHTSPKKFFSIAMVILILVNGIYYHSVYIRYSTLYEDYGFITMSSALDGYSDKSNLVFTNNYIYMRPYISSDLIQKGLMLPPPDTLNDLDEILETAPADTLFLISDNDKTTWYEYANAYIRPFTYADILTPSPLNISKLSSLSTRVLVMTFDDANETVVPDSSGYGNNGDNYGATLTTGYQGYALEFDGRTQYVTVRASESLNIQNEITIGFFAKIEETDFFTNGSVIAKGNASADGSYEVFVWDNQIRFSLGGVGEILYPIEPYVSSWHHFLFTYTGQKMELYVDGFLVAAKLANGAIRVSPFDLEIGVDASDCCFFNGCIDNLLIAENYVNQTAFIDATANYAPRIHTIPLPQGQANLFQLRNTTSSAGENITVHSSQIGIQEDRSVTIDLGLSASNSKNITILISTDRFTKVYVMSIVPGQNNLEFNFQFNASGQYWPYLSQARIVIIDNHRLVFNELLLVQNTESINIMLSIPLLGVLLTFLFVHWWKSNQGTKRLQNLLLRFRSTH